MRRPFTACLSAAIFLTAVRCPAEVRRVKFEAGGRYLVIEALDDDLIHLEASAVGAGPAEAQPLYTSPMVDKADYAGPSSFDRDGNVLETGEVRVEVDPTSLAVTVRDKVRGGTLLTSLRAEDLDQGFKRLRIGRGAAEHVYGLGQQFKLQGSADGDWTAFGVREGEGFGNGFPGFQRAAVGNVQIPVMYAVGDGGLCYALFLDNVYKQRWDFTGPEWEARMFGDQIRLYVITGPDLPDLRRDYLELTGRPPVPPKKAFGLWVSEFGYDNWGQVDRLKSGLRDAGFPVDGFVLDLNWFGGVVLNDSSRSRMGELAWDESNTDGNGYFFPDPGTQIRRYAGEHVELAVIEESYVADTTRTYHEMPAELTVFRRTAGNCDPAAQSQAVTNVRGFWGVGRMIDWSDPTAGRWVHDHRRFPNLVKKGVAVHWTDLGEPESFERDGCYEGVETAAGDLKNEHSDVHNLYNLLWNKSIWDGYAGRSGQADDLGRVNRRPLLLTRSGAAGTQRFGAAMWSGDIAGNLESLATHANAQLHMSFSGIDYYGADAGGFRREVLPYNGDLGQYRGYEEELYTQWFANACWFDVPVRPHTDNEFKRVDPPYATAPHLVGKRDSNLANLRQRYELTPYYYSLAYRAHLAGEPLVPPLVFYYQDDPNVRRIGHEKLIGRDLLVALVARHGEYGRDVYLPAGEWVDYHTNERVAGTGQVIRDVPAYRDGVFRLPTFARAGAILPRMHVDSETLDAEGHRRVGAAPRDELIVAVYASPQATEFTLYEDDGGSLGYDARRRPVYRHRTTRLSQRQAAADLVEVTIDPAVEVGGGGPVPGTPGSRRNVIRLATRGQRATAVLLGGAPLAEHATAAALEAADSGWCNAASNLIVAKSGAAAVSAVKEFAFRLEDVPPTASAQFVCDRGFTRPGESVYVVGGIPELGSWDVSRAVKLSPDVYYEYVWNPPAGHNGPGPSAPVWTGVLSGLPTGTTFEWKCIRKREDGTGGIEFEPGPNNVFTTGAGGYSGRAFGSF